MRVELPFPDRQLSPNRHASWRAKESARKDAKETSRILTRLALEDQAFFAARSYALHIVFHPKDRHRRDLDNLIAASKHYQDGFCEALGIDDSQIRRVLLEWDNPVKGGMMIFEINPLECEE